MFGRLTSFAYAIICYVVFLGSVLYAIGFLGNLVVPKSIDTPSGTPTMQALVINITLLGLFAVQHSVMARQWFKRIWTRLIPQHIERSTYVLIASSLLLVIFWQWRAIGVNSALWDVSNPIGRLILLGLFWLGWAVVLISTFLVDHFDLFGLRQVYCFWQGAPYEPPVFQTRLFYKVVRHPLYFGFLIAFWSAPRMTAGHLLFATLTTAYTLIAIQLEERDLVDFHGDQYRQYREQVPMLIPLLKRTRSV